MRVNVHVYAPYINMPICACVPMCACMPHAHYTRMRLPMCACMPHAHCTSMRSSPMLRSPLTLLTCLHVIAVALKPSSPSSRNHDCTEVVQVACVCRDLSSFGDNNSMLKSHSHLRCLWSPWSLWQRANTCRDLLGNSGRQSAESHGTTIGRQSHGKSKM